MTPTHGHRRQVVQDALILAGILLAVWQVLFVAAGSTTISSPWDAVKTASGLLASADFWYNFSSTLKSFLVATIIVAVVGVLIGLILGAVHLVGDAYEPILISLYTVPKVAFFPAILLIFGINMSAQVAFGVIHGIIPVAIFTLNAVRHIKRVHIRTAATMCLTPIQTAAMILLPAILPEVFTGIRMGVSLTFIGVLLSEMFGSHRGVGMLLMQAIGVGNGSQIMALTVLIVAFALSLNLVLTAVNRRLDPNGAVRSVH